MASEKTTAIVLRVVEFSETSVITTLFTEDFGKISALAKGARRPKSPFESAIDLLAVCRIVFLHKSSDVLDLLTEAKLERRFRSARRDLSRLYAGYYVAELLNALTDRGDPSPELFHTADAILAKLDSDGHVGTMVFWFELTILRLTGQLPSLEQCAACGASLPTTGRVAFGILAGGLLCPACRGGQRNVVSVSPDGMGVFRRFAMTPLEELSGVPLSGKPMGEARIVMQRYLANLLGNPPRLHTYLNPLSD